jgi:hypothetical protein
VRERENLVAMATLKVQQTEDEVRQKAEKAYREFEQHRDALTNAKELVLGRTVVVIVPQPRLEGWKPKHAGMVQLRGRDLNASLRRRDDQWPRASQPQRRCKIDWERVLSDAGLRRP